tara:strand:- start:853 stop:1122 length:270 start_codon:yes stop_codon:yes gene_type:complete
MIVEKRQRRWCFLDLVADHRTGKLRETAVWSNIGKLTMTWAFIYTIWKGGSSEFLWLAYGGVVVAHESAARFFNQRQQKIDQKTEEAKT